MTEPTTPTEAAAPDQATPSAEDADADTTPADSGDEADSVENVVPVDVEDDVLEDEDHLPPGQTEMPVGDEVVIDDDTMRRALEAILMVTDEPLPVLTLARAVGRPTGDVSAALSTLAEEYTDQGRGFDLREVGGGWRYYTRVEAAPYVERFVLDGQQARLTQAALETLAVVAYKQPVSRARVSAIRGVNVDGVMRTLVARGLVEEAGSDTESQATLYRTTSYFLERMGMHSLDDLPELAPYLPDMDDIEDELAAQTLPPTPSPDASPDDPGTPSEADDSGTPPTNEAAVDEPSTPSTDAADADEPSADQSDDADTGIDGDLSAGEPADLDVEQEPDAADAGIDGDLSAGESVDLDVDEEHDVDEGADGIGAGADSDRVESGESTGQPESADESTGQPESADESTGQPELADDAEDLEHESADEADPEDGAAGAEPADGSVGVEPAGGADELVGADRGVDGDSGSREEVRDGG
ncbi:SMC-Scp complex subunit ScpB [Kribbella sp. NPDC026596]|uniref:SMC-Scp complex subunit ScpB n=1 Tax=Kribbella sp. NPDC026596 TaxID=3155122 RepID=UPI0033D6A042